MTYLGIDLGTSSVKVVLLGDDGQLVREASAAYPTTHPEPGAAEQDPADWWRAVGEATRSLPIGQATGLSAIGLSGQMHGTVCLDEQGRLIRPAIIWSDTRGAEIATELTVGLGAGRLAALVGTPLAAGFLGVTAAWLRKNEPETWRTLATALLPKDYIRYRLTDELATDPSDAAGTGLLDVQSREWSSPMLDAVGLTTSQTPNIQKSAERAGRLSIEAADHLGLEPGLPVVTGGADAPLAAVGAGTGAGSSLLATLSSGAQVIAFASRPAVDPGLRVHTFASPLDPAAGEPGWYVMGATMVGGMALHWLRSQIFQSRESVSVAGLIGEAGTVSVGAGGLVFAPYLTGERTPHLDPKARAVFVGLTADHDHRHLVRAVMEGVVFALRDALDIVRELSPGAGEVVLAGGGARSPLWRQIVADIFAMPVSASLVADQSAVGAAVLAAAHHTKTPASVLGARWARHDPVVEPVAWNVGRYAELRAIFREIYPRHAADFRRLADFA